MKFPRLFKPSSSRLEVDEKLLREHDSFCMMPWVHFHVTQKGTVTPCCQAPWEEDVLGDINQQNMEEIWQGEKMNAFRQSMLRGKKDQRCTRCYEKEASGSLSLRKITNDHYLHHIERVNSTGGDGSLKNSPPVYFDLRFSNVCNFRCRICGPWSSSRWHKDAVALGMISSDTPALSNANAHHEHLLNQFEKGIEYVEEIYFAGGEPLMMDEHYHMLELLVKHGKTNVKLNYNTNFSSFTHKNWDVTELWKAFTHINIAASLDASGERGEYLRKEQNWEQTVNNRKLLLEQLPKVDFMISPTVYVLNVLHLPSFHKEWVGQGLIQPEEFVPTILLQPEPYNIRVLPEMLKKQASQLYADHLEWMKCQTPARSDLMKHAIQQFENIIIHLNDADHRHLLPELKQRCEKLDVLREESWEKVFPELGEVLG